MSGQAGVLFLDEKPVANHLLSAIANSLECRGSAVRGQVSRANIGMAFRGVGGDEEIASNPQPYVFSSGDIVTWDGRIDNRDDLVAQVKHCSGPLDTDVRLAAAAYDRWGSDFADKLIGEWSISLWDDSAKTLILATDSAGTRPIHYWESGLRFIWSSELETFVDVFKDGLRVDEEYVASYLACRQNLGRAPYVGVRSLRPGHIVTIRNSQVVERQYWSPARLPGVCYKKSVEYEEHLRTLFREAVRCRLRSRCSVWISLSGGLDSSCIVGMADDLLKKGHINAPRIETVSHVFDMSPECDERRFISLVEARRGRNGFHFSDSAYPLLHQVSGIRFVKPVFGCFALGLKAISDEMKMDGVQTLLSGLGGDELMGNTVYGPVHVADLLYQRLFSQVATAVRSWSYSLKRPRLSVFVEALSLLRTGESTAANSWTLLALASPTLRRRFSKEVRLSSKSTTDALLPSQRQRLNGYFGAALAVAEDTYRPFGTIEMSYPYLHRPLVEFLMAIPGYELSQPGLPRSLMRRGLGYLLPERILSRRSKGNPDAALARACHREWPWIEGLLKDGLVFECGYADREAVQTAVQRVKHGIDSPFLLLKMLFLELWLRGLARPNSRSGNHYELPHCVC